MQRRYASRLNSFMAAADGAKRTPEEAIALLASVPGIAATELNVGQHVFVDDASLIQIAREAGLEVTALNMRYDPPRFAAGAFTHPDAAVREEAISFTIGAIELCAREGIGHLIVWPGPDGFDYPFQLDYAEAWQWTVAAIRRVAAQQPAVRVSIEYKPSDPRRLALVRSMGEALLCAADSGLDNVGVTLDLCHSLMAGESPAAAASLALGRGRLFGLHLNDGYGPADDGMMVGSVRPWQLLELLFVLREHGWDGTIYFDTFPHHLDPVREVSANIEMVERMEQALDRLSPDAMVEARSAQNAIAEWALIAPLLGSPS